MSTVTKAAPPTTTILEPAQTTPGPLASFGPGTYVVGSDIYPGVYRTAGPSSTFSCYRARLKDTSGEFSSIITNGSSQGQTTVTIKPSDGAFETSGCKIWQKVG
jgi:hypothetical protein